jgi:hypothetical protein
MQHLEGSGTPVLYIGRTFLKVKRRAKVGELPRMQYWGQTVQQAV